MKQWRKNKLLILIKKHKKIKKQQITQNRINQKQKDKQKKSKVQQKTTIKTRGKKWQEQEWNQLIKLKEWNKRGIIKW